MLAGLPEPWTIEPGRPAGVTRGRGASAGPVGAWLEFYGIVRDLEPAGEQDERIAAIEYEAHERMALHQLERILDRLEPRYPLEAVLLVHRIGRVPVGEPSLLVRVLSGHRREALDACAELIDELKRWVPIWKHPESAEGTAPSP